MKILRNNRGVTLIFVAMGMLLFLLFLGLALDTGWLVYVRGQGQARIDSAALAAAVALAEPTSVTPVAQRQARAEELANTFSDKNSVVNSTVDPVNVVTPMTYDQTTGDVTEASDWELWKGDSPNCNAARVTTSVPTPVFFSGIRNVFGAEESGQEDITVSAVSHLPCPGIQTDEGIARIALVRAQWNFFGDCVTPPHSLDQLKLDDITVAALRTAIVRVPTQVNDPLAVSLQTRPVTPADLSYLGLCTESPTIVPVVDSVSSGSQSIKGFAALCVERDPEDGVTAVKLKCGEVAPSSAGGGECFGTYASNPILIR